MYLLVSYSAYLGTVWFGSRNVLVVHLAECGIVFGMYWLFLWYSVAGQVDVVHNGWHQGQTTKRGRDATFGPNCQILKLLLPNYFYLLFWGRENKIVHKKGQQIKMKNNLHAYKMCGAGGIKWR